MQKRVLILEDNHDRQEQFRLRYPGAVIVATAPECIWLLGEEWDLVYLDHYLGGHRLSDPDQEDCGQLVVLHVLGHRPKHLKETRFVVHSANIHRAKGMVEDLRYAGCSADCRFFVNLLPELRKWTK